MSEVSPDDRPEEGPSPIDPRRYATNTLVVSLIAAVAAWGCAVLGLAVWVMFAGVVAWFAHRGSWRAGASGVVCMGLGLVAGAIAVTGVGVLAPRLGLLALPLVVFAASIVVVGLRTTRGTRNTLAWFIGLVAFLASDLHPSAPSLLDLGAATLVGGVVGFLMVLLAPGLEKAFESTEARPAA